MVLMSMLFLSEAYITHIVKNLECGLCRSKYDMFAKSSLRCLERKDPFFLMLAEKSSNAFLVLEGIPAKIKIRNEPLTGISCSRCTTLASEILVTVEGVKVRPGVSLTPGILNNGDLAG